MMTGIVQWDAERMPLADGSVDLVFTSPPYVDARWYGDRLKHARQCIEWVDWMIPCIREFCRISRGLVLVNCAGVTRKHRYQPAPEMLLSEWWKQGGECWRPAYWNRVGIPGSGGKQWLRADVEYVLAFKGYAGPLKVEVDNTACGHPPKWGPGGEMSHRTSAGARVNQWGHSFDSGGTGGSRDNVTCTAPRPSHRKAMLADGEFPAGASVTLRHAFKREHTKSLANGVDEVQVYIPPVLANPGNLIKTIVGGGSLGHKLAHENEAPFPVKLAEFFIKSFVICGEPPMTPNPPPSTNAGKGTL